MTPKNKHQARVVELSKTLKDLRPKTKKWAVDTCIAHVGYRSKTKTACLMCGHSYKGSQTAEVEKCPSCGRKLKIETTRSRTCAQREFYLVCEVVEDFQVSRFFEIKTYHKTGQEAEISVIEVVSEWTLANGKTEVIARLRGGMGWNQDNFSGFLELRNFHYKYELWTKNVYPKSEYLPVFKRNGFNGKFGNITPHELFTHIGHDSKAETLLKAGQEALLIAYAGSGKTNVTRYWKTIKIALRNKYQIKKADVWIDYITNLEYCGKDILNAQYVCPAKLQTEHSKYIKKRQEIRKRLDLEAKLKQIAEDDILYKEQKAPFFGLVFTEGEIAVKVMESVQEFYEDGKVFHHCVYSNEYYKKENSLILSARVNGVPVETIEVSLKDMRVVQSRGIQNQSSQYNKQILQLVKKNIHEIAKRTKKGANIAA